MLVCFLVAVLCNLMLSQFVDVGGGAKVASEAEIKAAYKRKALVVHPDKHSDSDEATRKTAEEEFKKIGEALEILGDTMKRGLYDEGFDREAIEERISRCALRHFIFLTLDILLLVEPRR